MPRARLKVGEIAEVTNALTGTTMTVEEGLRAVGFDPAEVNIEHMRQQPRFDYIKRCRRPSCTRWISSRQYYIEGCPHCGWRFGEQ